MTGLRPVLDDRERVRDASDIVRVIGEHVSLRPRGREYVGLCPFHDDRRPSMNVVPHKQIFHCFVCGTGGDVFSFIQKFHKMEFREALEFLAERSHIELARHRPHAADGGGAGREGITRSDLVRANAAAAEFFRAILRHPEHGAAARGVIERRGISPEMCERFGLGAAPARWDGLLLTARAKGLDERPFVEAGLLKRREDAPPGAWYDTFRNRLMFPIHDQIGRVIAFGGRKINEEDEPKYLNSPETRVFEKSSTLFGLHQAFRAIQHEKLALVTEGYTDTIACHQFGLGHAVATLGTALTRGHAAVLRRLCDTVVLLFDGDDAGRRAADRATEVFFAESIDVKIATLSSVSDAKDPDELVRRPGGVDLLRRAIDRAVDALEFRYEAVRSRVAGLGTSAQERALTEELSRLGELGLSRTTPIRRQLILRRLHEITGLPASVIADAVPAGRQPRPEGAAPAAAPTRTPTPAEQLLGCLLCAPELAADLTDEQRDLIAPGGYSSPVLRPIAQAIQEAIDDGARPTLTSVLDRLDRGIHEAAVSLEESVRAVAGDQPDRLRAMWDDCLTRVAADRARAAMPRGDSDADRRRRIEVLRSEHARPGVPRPVLPRPATGGGPGV